MIGLGISLGMIPGKSGGSLPPPVIKIDSDKGYAGSRLVSSRPGQWTSNGVAIPGETGETLTMTGALEGTIIRCLNSNGLQMWTPMLFRSDLRNGGAFWVPDLAHSRASGKIIRIPNLYNPGFADQVQANTALQPTGGAILGRYGIQNPRTDATGDLGLDAEHALVMKTMVFFGAYKNGAETVQGGRYPAMFGGRINSQGRIHGVQGNNGLDTNAPFGPPSKVWKNGELMPTSGGDPRHTLNVFPMRPSVTVVEVTTAPTYAPVMGHGDAGGSTMWPGPIYLSSCHPFAFTVAERQMFEGYARHRFNGEPLIAGHPFFTSPPMTEHPPLAA